MERFVELRVRPARFAIRRTRNRSEFGKHNPHALLGSEANRRVEILLYRVRMTDDDIRRYCRGAGIAQRSDGIREFLRIDLVARFSLPLVIAGFKAQEECFETTPH